MSKKTTNETPSKAARGTRKNKLHPGKSDATRNAGVSRAFRKLNKMSTFKRARMQTPGLTKTGFRTTVRFRRTDIDDAGNTFINYGISQRQALRMQGVRI